MVTASAIVVWRVTDRRNLYLAKREMKSLCWEALRSLWSVAGYLMIEHA
jgi:hypothetical protein